MKIKHGLWQLTVFSILMVLCAPLAAQETNHADNVALSTMKNMTRGDSATATQALTLVSGWNWVGFNVLPTGRTVGDVLGTTGFTVNDIIQTNGVSARFSGTSWTPESFSIEYGKLYQIYVANDVAVVVNGVTAGLYTLPLTAGWNWIANSTLENAALSQLTHSNGWAENDRIQAAGGNGAAYISGKWIPSAFSMESGKGYQIFAGNAGTLLFPTTVVENTLYAVVDLSGGPDAANYPVRYTNEAPNLDDDTCRTTELWLRRIPAGTFMMGSPEDELGRQPSDMAQHEVTITQDYYIGVFECTQKQWELVMGTKPSYFDNTTYYASRPVEQVTYYMIRGKGWPSYGHAVDSTSFMGKLQAKTGLTFDLPTEAQWEYACRAGTTTALNSGKNLTSTGRDVNMNEVGRYLKNGGSVYSHQCTSGNGTAKVGSYLPNDWGLYDMHGNVWEWCLDWYGASISSTAAETDPVGPTSPPTSGSYHVSRGGYWYDNAEGCRSASRYNSYSTHYYYVGFRVLCLPRQDLYAVVDLSGGPDAANYPVRYTDAAPNLDDDTCRTTELWLRRIPKGTFMMGSPEDELGRNTDETQHEVTLTQNYYIGVFECTQKQWELVMGSNPSSYKGDCRPVETVSYNSVRGSGEQAGAGWPSCGHAVDASSFMGKLQAKTGLTFDLPTEAQWEYACRAGTTTALNSGKNLTATNQDANMNELGRYYYNKSDGKGGYSQHTTVGSYLPNAWGLYDMNGSVWEWCLDWFVDFGTGTESDPVGPSTGLHRVFRGGDWNGMARACRSTDRNDDTPTRNNSYIGFRIALHPKQDLYAVVDLSGGPEAANYPVRYTNKAPNLNDGTCRTTELWLRKIPAGTFIMGSPEDEVGRRDGDMTLHQVTITKMFYIGVFECTQKQWELVMGSNPSNKKGDCRPVEQVSFNMIRGSGAQAGAGWPTYGHTVDASSFMGKLQAKTGLSFDLPTEAQREYACRAGTTTSLYSGKNLTNANEDSATNVLARYRYNQSDGKGGYILGHTKVGSYLPNAWGLFDMYGNVDEWCLDWWGSSTTSTEAETDPVGPNTGTSRVVCCGGYDGYAYDCRSASRGNYTPSNYNIYFGFRVALHPQQDLYAIVDLSGGPTAASYPVRYTDAAPNLEDDACRTTELWLRRIPARTFTMGSPEDEVGRGSNDMEQHQVTLTQDYYIGVFECTQKQWELVMGNKPSYFSNATYYATRPVECVSFDMIRGTGAQAGAGWPTYGHAVDVSSFMGKLQAKTGLVLDLPTEAQWEYACRAGTTTALNSGKNLTSTSSDANMAEVGRYYYNGGSGYSQSCTTAGGTAKVGSYLPNAWGLYDMHGNVRERCLDWWGAARHRWRLRRIRPAPIRARPACYATAAGPTTRTSAVRRAGATTTRRTATTSSVSAFFACPSRFRGATAFGGA